MEPQTTSFERRVKENNMKILVGEGLVVLGIWDRVLSRGKRQGEPKTTFSLLYIFTVTN